MANAVHISLKVADLGRSVDFYSGLFGVPCKLKPDYAKFVGDDPEIHLALRPTLLADRASGGTLSLETGARQNGDCQGAGDHSSPN